MLTNFSKQTTFRSWFKQMHFKKYWWHNQGNLKIDQICWWNKRIIVSLTISDVTMILCWAFWKECLSFRELLEMYMAISMDYVLWCLECCDVKQWSGWGEKSKPDCPELIIVKAERRAGRVIILGSQPLYMLKFFHNKNFENQPTN